MPSLSNFGGFSRVHLFDYVVFNRIIYLQLPRVKWPLRMLLHTFALQRKRRASNYLMSTARVPFKSRALKKSLSPLAPSTSTSRWAQVESQSSDGTFQQVPSNSMKTYFAIV